MLYFKYCTIIKTCSHGDAFSRVVCATKSAQQTQKCSIMATISDCSTPCIKHTNHHCVVLKNVFCYNNYVSLSLSNRFGEVAVSHFTQKAWPRAEKNTIMPAQLYQPSACQKQGYFWFCYVIFCLVSNGVSFFSPYCV